MSEKTETGQEYDDEEANQFSGNIPEHQYSRDQLINISKSPLSGRRPKCLDPVYDADDGKWDPDRWYKAQFDQSGDVSPLTLLDGKDRRRLTDLDRDLKRRHSSVNDPMERLKEERDGIVLSPQRRSFGTGCHVQTTLMYSRQLTVPDRDEPRVDKDRDRDRDRDRPVRKIGSGRIQIDRENSRDYSGIRDRFDDRDIRDRNPDRDREFNWNREREWERDVRDRDRDVRDSEWDRDRDRDRRFDRSDRFRQVGDRDFPDRDRRDFRDRGFDRNSRRRNNYRDEEKEPEWFTGGPSSQTDTIELRGFDREGTCDGEGDAKPNQKTDNRKINTPSEDISSKESSEAASEPDVKVSECSSPEEDQQIPQNEPQGHQDLPNHTLQEEHDAASHQQSTGVSPSKYFDFEEILKARILPLDQDTVCQGSRFSRFFSGINGNKLGSDTSSMEDMLVPLDLLEDSHNSPGLSSPSPVIGPMASLPAQMGPMPHGMLHFQDQLEMHSKEHMFTLHQNLIPIPNPAGDNNAVFDKPALPPAVTALFNSATLGGSNASISSNSSFSTQDAEAQLKAMLFGGSRDSASSSGTASPASLPTSVQRKVKTVAELEADMHQNSPQKSSSGLSVTSSVSSTAASTEDMAAFNKLLIMMNAASEANQNLTQTEPQATRATFGVSSHNEFNHAVMRNKEEQMQLQQQSLHIAQQSSHSQPLLSQLPPHIPPPSHLHSHQQMPPLSQQPPPPLVNHQVHPQQLMKTQPMQQQHQHLHLQQQNFVMNHTKQLSGLMNKPPVTAGLPQTMASHPSSMIRPRAQSGGPLVSSDMIYSLIQQNPTIVMNPASPGPSMAAILASQQSAVPSTARIPSPLMFSQQPPLHLNAPSPIHPGQLSPRSLTVGTNLTTGAMGRFYYFIAQSPTGMRSPVLTRVLSPQELSVHAQAVMQSALIKQQLHDQNMRYQKKQLERAKSPSQQQINAARSQSASQVVTPSLPPKGLPVNTFLPTSVLRKMHSDKALEKEKQALEEKTEHHLTSSMGELGRGSDDLMDSHPLDSLSRKPDPKLLGDLNDISFLDPVNPELVAMSNQLENHLRIGQTNILPGPLSQPMSVEEKLKLSALAEKPGFLSQMLDKSAMTAAAAAAETARAGQGRPIVKAPEPVQPPADDRTLQQHFYALQQQQPPLPLLQGGRPVTGGSPKIQPSFVGVPVVQSNLAQLSSMQQNSMGKPTGGRAIVGGNSAQQQAQVSMVPNQNIDMLRLLDLQRLQQMPHSQGMVLPPPPIHAPIACLGPPPVAVPVSACIPVVGGPVQTVANAGVLHQQLVRANAMNAQHNRQISQFMARHQVQQHRKMAPLPSLHMVVPGVSAPLSPRSQASGPLSPAALSATIQRVASPHGAMKMNGPLTTNTTNGTGGPKVDVNSGIQRWFSPDILKNQLPSMPPLPAKGNQVMTVDELEGN
ncbi:hypothetical protein BsWGS_07696 [Bradybaena similaris]